MKLYIAPGSCSLSPHIALAEAGLTFETEKVDLKAKKTASGEEFLAINPKGYVPALRLDDGNVLTEGVAIVQYIADQRPQSKLAPAAGTLERYRLQEWLNFISTEIHKTYSPLFNPASTDDVRENAKKHLTKRLATVTEQLGKTPYLTGDAFTVADGYLFTVLRWSPHVKFDLAPFPAVRAFMERVASRDAVKKTLAAEGLS